MKKISFKNDFLVGVATSGPQTECGFDLDGKSLSTWDYWFAKDKNAFYDQLLPKNDIRANYKEYAKLAAESNINSFRTSIQWTRLIPDGENISDSAINFYRDYFNEIKSKNIKLFVCLYHFDMPLWLYEKHGFESKLAIDKYVYYAQKAFELFGDLVDVWFTFNEPIVPVEMGYFNRHHLPGVCDVKKAMQSLWNYLVAHIKTVAKFKSMNLKSEIGIILNITTAIAKSDAAEDRVAAEWASIFQYRSFLDPILLGEFPAKLLEHAKQNDYMWDMTSEEIFLLSSKPGIDLLGLNYYTPKRVQAVKEYNYFDLQGAFEGQLWEEYKWPKAVINKHRGWEIFPEGIYSMVKNIQQNYNNQKMFIAENGIGIADEEQFIENGIVNDYYRIDFFKTHLKQINKAIKEGANCIGYHIWTFVDNWSWLNAYKNRYGIYRLDLETTKIEKKKSFEWYSKFAKEKSYEE